MAYATRVTYVAAAGQRDYDVTFPYLDAAHVEVLVRGVPQPATAFDWIGNNRIQLKVGPVGGSVVRLNRRTPLDHALVQFRNGSVLAEEELNRAVQQILYVQQELADLYQYSLDEAQVRLGDNLAVVTTPDKIMDELAALVLADDLLVDLVERIGGNQELADQIIKEALRGVELKRGVNVVRERVTSVETQTESLAAVLNLLAILASDGQSLVLREDKVYRGNGLTYAQAFTQIETNFGNQSASIQTLGQTLTSTGLTLAKLSTTLGAYDTGGTSLILNEATVKRANGVSLADTFTGLYSRIGNAEAAVVANNQAIVDEAGARASAVSGVLAQLGPIQASVTTVSQANTALGAKWGVALNVNGHISGIVTNNNGQTSDFNIIADRFRIVAPGGGTPITVFQTDGAYASFANPVTVTAGSYKLVMGPAFGAQSNLILWYGPSWIPVPSCSTSNAIFALTVNGQTVIPGTGGGFRLAVNTPAAHGTAFTWPSTVQTNSIVVTPQGNTGSVTYQWACTSRNVTIVAPSNNATTFMATLQGSTSAYEGTAICTATDTATGQQAQIVVTVVFTTNV